MLFWGEVPHPVSANVATVTSAVMAFVVFKAYLPPIVYLGKANLT